MITNSSVLIQHIQWALALPNAKVFSVLGSSTNGDYPYAVTAFAFSPVSQAPEFVAAEIARPEIAATTPGDLRRALELRRARQARLRVTPREHDSSSDFRHGSSAASRFVTAVRHAAHRAREGRKQGGSPRGSRIAAAGGPSMTQPCPPRAPANHASVGSPGRSHDGPHSGL
jgi:hypothetical protein